VLQLIKVVDHWQNNGRVSKLLCVEALTHSSRREASLGKVKDCCDKSDSHH
jgi:hypothetical protein